jgi:hypothetical protein
MQRVAHFCLILHATNLQNAAENWMLNIVVRLPHISGKQMDVACSSMYFEHINKLYLSMG